MSDVYGGSGGSPVAQSRRAARQLAALLLEATGAGQVGAVGGGSVQDALDSNDAAIQAAVDQYTAQFLLRNVIAERVAPTGFDWVPARILGCDGPGLARHAFDAESAFDAIHAAAFAGQAQIWVDPVAGSDLNTGAFNAPKATLKNAVQSNGVGTVWLKSGTYTERFDVRASDNLTPGGVARAIKIKAWDGPGAVQFRAPGQQPSAMNWATVTGMTYAATPAGGETANAIVWREQNREVVVQRQSSALAVNATNNGWFQDAGTKQINIRYEGRNIEAAKGEFEIIYDRGATVVALGARIFLDNIEFRGESFYNIFEGAFRPFVFARNCAWSYAPQMNIYTAGASLVLDRCTSENACNGDGGNYYDDASGQVSEVLEVDCSMRSNGQQGTLPFDGVRNKQGSSGHQNSVICRINGTYSDNYGQNIADTGAGSRTWMVGSVLPDPYGEIGAGGGIGGYQNLWTEGTAYLDRVLAAGEKSTYGLQVESGQAFTYLCHFAGTIQDTRTIGAATLAAFDPRAPNP